MPDAEPRSRDDLDDGLDTYMDTSADLDFDANVDLDFNAGPFQPDGTEEPDGLDGATPAPAQISADGTDPHRMPGDEPMPEADFSDVDDEHVPFEEEPPTGARPNPHTPPPTTVPVTPRTDSPTPQPSTESHTPTTTDSGRPVTGFLDSLHETEGADPAQFLASLYATPTTATNPLTIDDDPTTPTDTTPPAGTTGGASSPSGRPDDTGRELPHGDHAAAIPGTPADTEPADAGPALSPAPEPAPSPAPEPASTSPTTPDSGPVTGFLESFHETEGTDPAQFLASLYASFTTAADPTVIHDDQPTTDHATPPAPGAGAQPGGPIRSSSTVPEQTVREHTPDEPMDLDEDPVPGGSGPAAVGGGVLGRMGLVVDPVPGGAESLFEALVRMHPEHGSAAGLRAELLQKFQSVIDNFSSGAGLVGSLLEQSRHLPARLGVSADDLRRHLADRDSYADLVTRLRGSHGPTWAETLGAFTADNQWESSFTAAAPQLYARHTRRGLLTVDPTTGHITALHPNYTITHPDPDHATRLAAEHHYTVLAHTPGHHDATTPTPPRNDPAPPTRRDEPHRPPTTAQPHPPHEVIDLDPDPADRTGGRGRSGDDHGPISEPAYVQGIPKEFEATALETVVSVGDRKFQLPKGKSLRSFAYERLKGTRTGLTVTFTNRANDSFSRSLSAAYDLQVLRVAGAGTSVFGVHMRVPDAPADHRPGTPFGGWYARLFGKSGHRVVQWSRTGGAGFTPEGEPTPYDEPNDVYRRRLAQEAGVGPVGRSTGGSVADLRTDGAPAPGGRVPDLPGGQVPAAQAQGAAPVVGALVPVPGDGLCLLSSVVVSAPETVREGLVRAGTGNSVLDRALADAVRPGAVPNGIRTLAEGVRDAVADWLARLAPHDVPADVVRTVRANTLQQRHDALRHEPRERIVQALHDLGVDTVPDPGFLPARTTHRLLEAALHAVPGTDPALARAELAARLRWVWDPERANAARDYLTAHRIQPSPDPTLLRDQFLDLAAHQAAARNTTPQQAVAEAEDWIGWRIENQDPHGAFQTIRANQPAGIVPLDLLDRDTLTALLLTQDTPLTAREHADLLAAVRTWETSWTDPAHGETFPPLLAHALGIRLRINVHGDTDHTQDLGPAHAPVITVHHTHNHYDASTPAAPPKRAHQADHNHEQPPRPTHKRPRTTPGTAQPTDRTVLPIIDWSGFTPPTTTQLARQTFVDLTRRNPTPPRPTPTPGHDTRPADGRGAPPASAGTRESSVALAFVYGDSPDTLEGAAEVAWHGQDIPTRTALHDLLMTHEDDYRTDYRRFHAELARTTDPRHTKALIDDYARRYRLHPATVGYWATLDDDTRMPPN
ncbi:hypothetical protein AB0K51_34200 [Kitasatospora sp. NPDC049285]|uniref:hypothetical protein n=1 Tax=Kitasatospora sp. NPDC049285 TaxID=3157096 RepID=UPI00343461C2